MRSTRALLPALLLVLCAGGAEALPPRPAPVQTEPVALVGGTAHLGTGEVVDSSVILFADGVLTLVGDRSRAEVDLGGHRVVDVTGLHVYPGFVLPASQLGLEEVASLRDTVDHEERGDLNPNVRAIVAYNTDSEVTPTTRFNGVLTAQVAPSGGILSGTSGIVQLDAWNWEDAALVSDDGVWLNWPQKVEGRFDFTTFSFQYGPNEAYDEQMETLTTLFGEAAAYATDPAPLATNLTLAALAGLFDGSQRLYVRSQGPRDIVLAVRFAEKMGVRRVVVVGGQAVLQVADFLRERDIPVVLEGVHELPARADDDVDLPYRLPGLLVARGLRVGLTYPSVMNARNLPFLAGTAAAYGLEREQAVRMISLSNAEILGIEGRLGSLEAGKDATLFVSRGDALDMRGNQVVLAFIGGREIVLEGMQQELYHRFHEKYARP